MTHEPARRATLAAVKHAREMGAMVSFDPNLRPPLWSTLEAARDAILEGLKYANLVKFSEEEIQFISGLSDVEMVFVTLGQNGCYYKVYETSGIVPAFKVKTVDTTGAGDAFLSGMLYQLLSTSKPIEKIHPTEVKTMVRFANAVAAVSTTRWGAITALPSFSEVEILLRGC